MAEIGKTYVLTLPAGDVLVRVFARTNDDDVDGWNVVVVDRLAQASWISGDVIEGVATYELRTP